ncbi:MAG TPA: SsrA-binding protein SmpB [Planctomycetes bacterium]|nr:SsrA-binding protein SmpB [Planctomycetota bacterium]HIN80794.1 SsrA-binding protein SmpB [Planctomycetota bacterium]
MRVIAQNKRARHELEVLDRIEAGIVLLGSEVKSLRAGQLELVDAYLRIDGSEAFLLKARIPPYDHGGYANHEPTRKRKLLLHRREIQRLRARIEQKGLTVVPLKVYFNDHGKVKVELGIGRGRKAFDKRQSIKKRELDRQAKRAMRDG